LAIEAGFPPIRCLLGYARLLGPNLVTVVMFDERPADVSGTGHNVDHTRPPLVPFVQVALTFPMAVLAIPAGVLADNVDRRRMILAVQLVVLASERATSMSASACTS
jgi:MFS family permease